MVSNLDELVQGLSTSDIAPSRDFVQVDMDYLKTRKAEIESALSEDGSYVLNLPSGNVFSLTR